MPAPVAPVADCLQMKISYAKKRPTSQTPVMPLSVTFPNGSNGCEILLLIPADASIPVTNPVKGDDQGVKYEITREKSVAPGIGTASPLSEAWTFTIKLTMPTSP